MKTLIAILVLISMVSCYKPEPPAPPEPFTCNDILIYKHFFYSELIGRFIYTMQWKRPDGSFYNLNPDHNTFWSKNVGDRRC